MHRLTLAAPLLCLLLQACRSGDAVPASPAVVRDSAGITIVENTPAPDLPAWRLADTPELTIGLADGDADYLLERVGDVRQLEDGRIVLANGQRELRMYDASGQHLWTAGRQGDGPGEFRQLWHLTVFGDTIQAGDAYPRISLFTTAGAHIRSYTVEERPYMHLGFAPDRTAYGFGVGGATAGFDPGYGIHADTAHLVRHTPDGEVLDTLFSIARSAHLPPISYQLEFSPVISAVVGADRIYVGQADRYQVRVHDLSGAIERIIRNARPPESIGREVVAALEEERAARLRASTERALGPEPQRGLVVPDVFPTFRGLRTDTSGNLWVRLHALDDDPVQEWDVYDSDGRLVAGFSAPSRFRIREIGPDYVLGVHVDELDIQTVRRYRLTKSS
jgi:hypothetical protein